MSEHSLTRQAMEAALRALEQQVQEEQAGTINSWLCPHLKAVIPKGASIPALSRCAKNMQIPAAPFTAAWSV